MKDEWLCQHMPTLPKIETSRVQCVEMRAAVDTMLTPALVTTAPTTPGVR